MSLSTAGEMMDQPLDLTRQFGEGPVVVDHDIRTCESRTTVDLSRDPRTGIVLGEASLFDKSSHGSIRVEVDDDEQVEVVSSGLDQERNVQDDGLIGRCQLGQPSVHLGSHCGMDDLVEARQLNRIREDAIGKGLSIQLTAGQQNLSAELVDDRPQNRLAGALQLSGDRVGVHDHEARIDQQPRYGRLTAADTPGEPDQIHGGQRYPLGDPVITVGVR